MLKFFLYLLCFTIAFPAYAKLYKVVGEDGRITYTDVAPSMDAKDYKLGNISAVGNPAFNMQTLKLRIPFTKESGVMMTQGLVNGVSVRFIIDTGASLVAIPPNIAKQAGLTDPLASQITVQTANGAVKVPQVSLKEIKVANVKQTEVTATIQSVSTTDPSLGLLGMSFFKNYNMTINDQKKEIQLEAK